MRDRNSTPREVWEELRRQAEEPAGQPVVLRRVREPAADLVGRISQRAGYLLVEYSDAPSGYFWDLDNLREMIEHVRQGRRNVTIYRDRWEPHARQGAGRHRSET